ncbi:MAG TPA: hypothetical protein VF134_03740 [Candidatus Dormibacteraeota bacterium]
MDQLKEIVGILTQIHDLLDPVKALLAPARELADLLSKYLVGTYNAEATFGAFTDDPTIRHFQPFAVALADAALVPVVAWAFFRVMFGHGTRTQYTARILLPRIVISAALINFSLPLMQAAVDFNNVLCRSILLKSTTLDFRTVLGDWIDRPAVVPLQGVVLAGLAGGMLLLGFAYVIRYALLVLLAILAPIAALLTVLPETQHFARTWGHTLVTTLLMQPLQLLVLGVGFQLEANTKTLAGHFFALAALWLCFKVPGAMHAASKVGSKAESAIHHEADRMVKLAANAVKAA